MDGAQKVLIFGIADLVVALFNCIHLMSAVMMAVIVPLEQSGVYRNPQTWYLTLAFGGAYLILSLLGVILPLTGGVGLLRRRKLGYFLHLIGAIPGGLLFFPPFGIVYTILVFVLGRGEVIRAELR